MKCFVINLKRAVERKQYVTNQLNQVSQMFEIVEGIDWKVIDPNHLPKNIRNIKMKNSYRSLSLGEVGCNLSHRKVLEGLVNSKEKMIVVLEDDAQVSSDFPDAINALENSHHEFDIVFLYSKFNETELVNLFPLNTKFSFSLGKYSDGGTVGYVITNKAAKEFLRILPDVMGPMDDELHADYIHGLKTFTLNPQIVFQGEIGERFSYNREKRKRKKVWERIMRFWLKIYEFQLQKAHYRNRIQSEKIN